MDVEKQAGELARLKDVRCINWVRTVSYTHLDVYKRQGKILLSYCVEKLTDYRKSYDKPCIVGKCVR